MAEGPRSVHGTAYVRHRNADQADDSIRMYGPKGIDHPTVGVPCAACALPFAPGDYTTLIPLGPGAEPEERLKARNGAYYNAVAVEVHWACATGREVRDAAE